MICCQKQYINCILLFCFVLLLQNRNLLYSQDQARFTHFTSENGLSENVIYSVLQDSRGYLWVGTWDGLNRYDGYSFKKFYHNPFDTISVSGNTINCIYEDKKGNLWVGTNTGLCRYNYDRGDFLRISRLNNLSQYNVSRIIAVSNTELLLQTGSAILLLNTTDLKAKEIFLESSGGLQHFGVNSPFFYKEDGGVYVCGLPGQNIGINVYYPQKEVFRFFPLDFIQPPDEFKDITPQYVLNDKNGNVWVCTNNERILVFGKKGDFLPVNNDPLLKKHYTVQCLYNDMSGNVWIGTEQGLLQYGAATGEMEFYASDFSLQSLSSPSINCVYADKTGIIWVGTLNGLNKLMPSQKKFRHLTASAQGLFSNFILGLYSENEKQIRIHYNLGVRQFSKFSFADNTVRHYQKSDYPGMNYLKEVLIHQSSILSPASLQSFQEQFFRDNQNRFLPPRLIADTGQKIWYAQFQFFGVFRLNSGGQFVSDTLASFRGEIYDMQLDGENVWLATANEGLACYNLRDRTLDKYVSQASRQEGINSNEILCIFVKKNNIWVGTKGGGLNYFDKRQKTFLHYTTEQGLCNNSIYCMVEDDNQFLWLGTSNGLSRFDANKKTFRNYFRSDGLMNTEFNRYSALKTRDGQLFFGGMNGIDYFYPQDIIDNHQAPQLLITDVKIFNKSINLAEALSFSYKNNYISFEFAAIDFRNPSANKFAYKLEGVDKDWVYIENRNFASYPTLQPGRYRFLLIGANSDGIWNNKPVEIKFIIRTPWWRTSWFYISCGIVVIMLLYTAYSFRIRQLKKMLALRTKISRDLHDEVGATLTSISYLSEVARKENTGNKKTATLLERIGEYSRTMIAEMNDIVWAINPSNDNFEKIIDRMQNFASPLLSSRNIRFMFEADPRLKDVSLSMQQRKNLYLVFKEAVNNAAKYSEGSLLNVKLDRVNGHINLEIADNGKGFNTLLQNWGNGLHNMKARTQEIQGKYSLTSSEGNGTSIKIEIPITQNAYMENEHLI